MTQYIKQSDLKDWRNANGSDKCPITSACMDDCVVDHSHDTGKVRGVLHRQSNVLLGKIENAWKRYVQKSTDAATGRRAFPCLDTLIVSIGTCGISWTEIRKKIIYLRCSGIPCACMKQRTGLTKKSFQNFLTTYNYDAIHQAE